MRKLRHSARAGSLFALAALLLAPVLRTAVAAPAPPNIVLIISDDHGWTDYSFMGHPYIRTPHLDRLAAQSRVFTRGYVTSPLCSPSLASIITGRYVHQHHIVCNDPPNWPKDKTGRERLIRFIEEIPTLPRMLAKHGYVSFQAGKWWLGHYTNGGFTAGMTHGDTTRGGRHGDAGLAIGRDTMEPVLDFVRNARREGKPFFLWYAPMLPHRPHDPPKRLLAKYQDKASGLPLARYWANIERLDETCGELLNLLDSQDLTTNTIVFYVADNGMAYLKDGTEHRSKRTPYEKGIRTPLLVRWPGHVDPGRSEMPVSTIDLVPTALAAAGTEKPAGLPGINLLDKAAILDRKAVFGAVFDHTATVLDDPAANLQCRWIVDGNWKLITPTIRHESRSAKPELYDLTDDPDELRNLADQNPQRLHLLKVKMNQWWPVHTTSPGTQAE